MFVCLLKYIFVHTVDKGTIKRINKGDGKAFEGLYTAYYVYLCAVATKYVFQPEVAKEIVNDVFLNIWNNRASLLYPIKPYLIRSAQNRSQNYLQRQRSQIQLGLSKLKSRQNK